jgi:hypothetical protein
MEKNCFWEEEEDEEEGGKKNCKYPCFFTYIVVEVSTVCMEDGRIDVV